MMEEKKDQNNNKKYSMWDYCKEIFGLIHCQKCQAVFKKNNATSQLLRHIQRKHIQLLNNCQSNNDQNTLLNEDFKLSKFRSQKIKLIDNQIARFIIQDIRPYQTVEGKRFQDFIHKTSITLFLMQKQQKKKVFLSNFLNGKQWIILEEILSFLSFFKEIINYIQSNNIVIISSLLPLIESLHLKLKQPNPSCPLLEQLRSYILLDFNERIQQQQYIDEVLKVTTYLDSKFKNLHFIIKEEQKKNTEDFIIKLFNDQNQNKMINMDTEEIKSHPNKNYLDGILPKIYLINQSIQQEQAFYKNETLDIKSAAQNGGKQIEQITYHFLKLLNYIYLYKQQNNFLRKKKPIQKQLTQKKYPKPNKKGTQQNQNTIKQQKRCMQILDEGNMQQIQQLQKQTFLINNAKLHKKTQSQPKRNNQLSIAQRQQDISNHNNSKTIRQ